MLKEIVIAGALLCPNTSKVVCTKPPTSSVTTEKVVFVRAMTHWEKLDTKTIYNSKEQKNQKR